MPDLNLFKNSFESPESSGVMGKSEVVEMSSTEETDEGLDSCIARGGKIVVDTVTGKKRCVLGKQTGGQKVGNKISGLLAEEPTAAPSGILGVFRKVLGL